MKNVKRFLTLFLLLGLMLSVAVFAEGGEPGTINTIEISKSGVTAADYEGEVNFKLTYSDAADGGMYLVLVQSETGVPTGENILYVNQVTAGEDPEVDGAYFANVYPSEIVYEEVKAEEGNNYSYIYLSGTDLPRELVGTIIPNVEVPADDVTVIAIGKNENIPAYTVDGHNVTVTYSLPCKVGYENADGNYTAIVATDNGDGSYDYVVPEDIDEVVVVVKGDANSDGVVTLADSTRTKAVVNKKTSFVSDYAEFAANVNTDNEVTLADSTRTKAVVNKKTSFTW